MESAGKYSREHCSFIPLQTHLHFCHWLNLDICLLIHCNPCMQCNKSDLVSWYSCFQRIGDQDSDQAFPMRAVYAIDNNCGISQWCAMSFKRLKSLADNSGSTWRLNQELNVIGHSTLIREHISRRKLGISYLSVNRSKPETPRILLG
jgi:hypothetical protein